MKPNFILMHCEGCLNDAASISHIILVPVKDGERQPTIEYLLNPKADDFLGIMSGITRAQMEAAPTYDQLWPEIELTLAKYPIVVSTNDGYSIRALHGTLERLGVHHADLDYFVVGAQDLRVVGAAGLSGKMKKAETYRQKGQPIEILTETDFLEMIS